MGFFKYSMTFLNSITFATTGYEALDNPLKGVVKSYLFQQQSYLNEAPIDEELNTLKADISSQWDNMILFVKPKYAEALRLSGVTQISNNETVINKYGDETTTGSYYEPKVSGTQAQINTNGQKVEKAQDTTTTTRNENLVLDSISMAKFLEDLRENIEGYFIEFVNSFFDLDEENLQLGQLSQEQRDAVNSGINSTLVGQITINENNISSLQSGKQNKLSTTQMNAVNSGITSTLVEKITTNENNITSLQENKQDNLSTVQMNAVNSGIDSEKVSQIATNTENIAENTEDIQTIATAVIDINKRKQNIKIRTSTRPKTKEKWSAKTWNGYTNINGANTWTDGTNIYYSGTSPYPQYVLDIATSTWSAKTWNGFDNIRGGNVWSDGTNIYYSSSSSQYVLDIATSTWSAKTWNGLTSFSGQFVWTDGTNIYYSSGSNQYVLDIATSTWSAKTWNGLTSFSGYYIWTDGTNIYSSDGDNQYVLDIATSTWVAKTWSGLDGFKLYGNYIWTDGINIYFSGGSSKYPQYVLDIATLTWSAKTWEGFSIFSGGNVWSDGTNIYYSSSSSQYILEKSKNVGCADI